MRVPKKIKVGDWFYGVKKRKKINRDGVDCLGETDFNKKTITLVYPYPSLKHTLLHELLHTVEEHLGRKLGTEDQIDSIAHCLRMVFLDNPRLLKILKK